MGTQASATPEKTKQSFLDAFDRVRGEGYLTQWKAILAKQEPAELHHLLNQLLSGETGNPAVAKAVERACKILEWIDGESNQLNETATKALTQAQQDQTRTPGGSS